MPLSLFFHNLLRILCALYRKFELLFWNFIFIQMTQTLSRNNQTANPKTKYVLSTELYRINRERNRYLSMRLTIKSCFVTYVLPSRVTILAIYYTQYGLCQIRPLNGSTYENKKQRKFWLHPPPSSSETCGFLCLF